MTYMKKTAFVLITLVSLVAMSFRITKKEDPIYKNLKVLPKNITKEQMDSVMHHFTVSLGVKCNFCHVRNEATNTWDMASDGNKHKLVAREMMKMTEKINDKYFDVTGSKGLNAKLMVTCYTCHHGKAEPDVKPMPQEERQGGNFSDSARRNRPQPDSTARNK
jgi:hypothetical protein